MLFDVKYRISINGCSFFLIDSQNQIIHLPSPLSKPKYFKNVDNRDGWKAYSLCTHHKVFMRMLGPFRIFKASQLHGAGKSLSPSHLTCSPTGVKIKQRERERKRERAFRKK
jgi:hypothetical protein